MLNSLLEAEYWGLIIIISIETSNELFLYHLPGRFLSCQVVLGAPDRSVELFLAHLFAACHVLMDLVDRQPHPLRAGLPQLESSGRQCRKDVKKLFF